MKPTNQSLPPLIWTIVTVLAAAVGLFAYSVHVRNQAKTAGTHGTEMSIKERPAPAQTAVQSPTPESPTIQAPATQAPTILPPTNAHVMVTITSPGWSTLSVADHHMQMVVVGKYTSLKNWNALADEVLYRLRAIPGITAAEKGTTPVHAGVFTITSEKTVSWESLEPQIRQVMDGFFPAE